MNTHKMTHGTSIYCFGNKEELTKKLQKQKENIEKNKFEIQEYVIGEKILYKDKENKEIRIWEIRNC